jgi:hypothetical protein
MSHEVVEATERRTVIKLTYSVGPLPARAETKQYLVHWVGSELKIVSQKNAPREEVSFISETPSMVTRDEVGAYLKKNKRQFETELFYFLREKSSISRGSGIHRIYSYEILEADTTRVVLKLGYHYWWYGQRAESKEFLLNWQGDKLVFVSHKGL